MEHHSEERLRRHSAEQEALANLTSGALSGRSVEDIAADAVTMIDRILDIRGASIWLVRKQGAIALAARHGEDDLPEEMIRTRIESSQSSIHDRKAFFVITDSSGPAGAVIVTALKRLHADEVHFLRAIANVLAQASARDAANAELRTRAAQQIAIAQFGRFALLGITQELLEHLCEVVAAVLEVDYSNFLEYDRESNTFHLGAGRWWGDQDLVVPADESSLSGYTAIHGGPLVVTDYATEDRFAKHTYFAEAGITSGLAAEIRGEKNLYGVITAHSRAPRRFGDTDARFLQALANAAAEAMERDTAQRARQALEVELEKANRVASLGRLAATIAHEFNNVLMGISPFVELLKRSDIAFERRLIALDHMTRSIQRGRRITEEILRFTNPPEPVFEAVQLWQWGQSIAHEMRPLLGSQYTFTVDANDRKLRALADIGQLHQVISNLVINARDAMPDGGRITLRICRETGDSRFDFGVVPQVEHFAHIIVRDEGIGMSPETRRQIFEPLFTTKRNGTGLGLAIAHQVIGKHGGSIFVESEPGKGTSFHVFLPLANGDTPKRHPEMPATNTPAKKARVLLVEDDPNVATGIALLLRDEHYTVDVVNLGSEALEEVERRSPDLVILDLGLPDIEGTKVYEQIAASHPELPIIFSTGHGDEKRLEQYLARGNVAMLLKPYDIDTLIATINRVTPSV